MAAIASITNGEAMSSVRTKLNSVITEINILEPTDWIDYSATSTIVGWSSFTTKVIKYRIIGKQIFVIFVIDGTSNNTATTFTLPNNNASSIEITIPIRITNNGVNSATPGLIQNVNNSSTVSAFTNMQGAAWTASGSKTIFGQFFTQIA